MSNQYKIHIHVYACIRIPEGRVMEAELLAHDIAATQR